MKKLAIDSYCYHRYFGDAYAWQRPVPGEVARPFTFARSAPFRAGAHRGIDLRARVGSRARAACAGVVAAAGPRVVTLRCGPWRVTALPLSSVFVRLVSS